MENNSKFVDVNGRDIKVVVAEKTGEILIPLEELKQTGFTIYRKSQYNKLLVDEAQIQKEFNLYMLQAAKTYMLENKTRVEERELLQCIDNCKKILIGECSVGSPSTPASNFMKNRTMKDSPIAGSLQITTNNTCPNSTNHGALTTQNLNAHNQVMGQRHEPRSKTNSSAKSPSLKENGWNTENGPADRRQSEPHRKYNNNSNRGRNNERYSEPFNHKQNSMPGSSKDNYQTNQHNRKVMSSTNSSQHSSEGELKESLTSTQLEINTHYKVIISHIEAKNTVAWIQLDENSKVLTDLHDTLQSTELSIIETPLENDLCCAIDEGFWFRCRIITVKPLKVFFVDYGNTKIVDEVRCMPIELKSIPTQAVRISFFDYELCPALYKEIIIMPTKRYETGTYSVRVKPHQTSSNKTTPKAIPKVVNNFSEIPEPNSILKSGEKVMVCDVQNEVFIMRNRSDCNVLKNIQEIIHGIQVYEPVVEPKSGQLVLCKRNGDTELSRGVIQSIIDNGTVQVKYLDYSENVNVDVNTVKNITENLAHIPTTFMISPKLRGFTNKPLGEKALAFIVELINNKTKLTVDLAGSNFDLKYDDGASLSAMLINLDTPVISSPSNRFMLSDMKCCEPLIGINKCICYSFVDLDNITLVLDTEAILDYLQKVIVEELNDENPYNPIIGEVCLGKFEEAWYRCTVVEISGDNYTCYFVDFGNVEHLKMDCLRQMKDDLKTIPILGIKAKLVDVDSDKLPILKKHIVEGESKAFQVVRFENNKYCVKVPDIYEKF